MDAKTVLLVDDDVDLLDINRITLEGAGFDVLTAENGDEAMRVATTTHVDVAVLDVMMTTPTEGFLLARAMRQDDRTKHIPLLMLTSVNAETRRRARRSGSRTATATRSGCRSIGSSTSR